jgi:O-antigen ligase
MPATRTRVCFDTGDRTGYSPDRLEFTRFFAPEDQEAGSMVDRAGARAEQPAMRDGLSFRKPARPAPARSAAHGGLDLFERSFVIFSVAVFLGLSNLARTADSSSVDASQHNPLNTTLYCIVLAVCAILVLLRKREVIPVLAVSKLVWIFMAWAVASIIWSIDPDLAARRLILFLAPVLVALYAAARFDPSTAIRLAGWAYFWTIVASAVVAVLVPSVGVMHDSAAAIQWADLADGARLEGDWSGILGHKNVLGFATLANTQVFVWRWYVEKEKRWRHAAIALFGMFVAYKTHSATTALLIALTLATYFLFHVMRQAVRHRALIFFGAIVVAAIAGALAIALPEQFTALLGKDASLTGRVPIWIVLLNHVIPNSPIFGYGFNTYFIPENPDYLRLVDIIGWPAPHAHNGYLNLAVELGIPGAVLGILILLRLIAGGLRRVNDEQAPWVLYVLVFGVTFAILNLVESSLLRISDNWAFALLFCCFALWKYQAEARPKTPAVPRRWREFAPKRFTELP